MRNAEMIKVNYLIFMYRSLSRIGCAQSFQSVGMVGALCLKPYSQYHSLFSAFQFQNSK